MTYSVRESSEDGFATIELLDNDRGLKAVVVPELGNNTVALTLRGLNFLWRPSQTLRDLLAARLLFGIPFLAPWANRLSKREYWVGDRCYQLNASFGNLRFDHHGQVIHGLLLFEPWTVTELEATSDGARLVSRMHFSARPSLMSQFPFAHTLEMRHLVRDGRLQITLRIANECIEAFPVSIGFHPYYAIPETCRDDWQLRLAARTRFELNRNQTPTGVTTSVEPCNLAVKEVELDDVFSGLTRNEHGEAHFSIGCKSGSLKTGFGPRYKVAVIYAPRTHDFVCIEPMATITNALNLRHEGFEVDLPMVEPGGYWEESFWVEPSLAI
ncbi:MAG TPA: aldose 1-epimerase [Bryobacteraceae bacterium]|jgi:aldose 1-epimerase